MKRPTNTKPAINSANGMFSAQLLARKYRCSELSALKNGCSRTSTTSLIARTTPVTERETYENKHPDGVVGEEHRRTNQQSQAKNHIEGTLDSSDTRTHTRKSWLRYH